MTPDTTRTTLTASRPTRPAPARVVAATRTLPTPGTTGLTPLSTGVSPTLAIDAEVRRRRGAGLPTVALGFGEASIPVLPELVDQLRRYADRAAYGPVGGIGELREAAAGYWTRRGIPAAADRVIVGPGSKPLLFALLRSLGGAVALPKPCWVSYAAQLDLVGQDAEHVATPAGEGGVPDPAVLDALAERRARQGRPLRAVLLTLVDNPTGTHARAETVRALVEVARRHDLAVISDEIYRDLLHDPADSVLSPASLAPERTYVTTGLSKSLAVGGWRIGVMLVPDVAAARRVRDDVLTLGSEVWSAAALPVQYAAAWAFDEPAVVRERVRASAALHGTMVRAVTAVFRSAGASVAEPSGAFYLYPVFSAGRAVPAARGIRTGADLAGRLLADHGVATLPGEAFGDDPERLALRIAVPTVYGSTPAQKQRALESDDPARLPWVAASLSRLGDALGAVRGVLVAAGGNVVDAPDA